MGARVSDAGEGVNGRTHGYKNLQKKLFIRTFFFWVAMRARMVNEPCNGH